GRRRAPLRVAAPRGSVARSATAGSAGLRPTAGSGRLRRERPVGSATGQRDDGPGLRPTTPLLGTSHSLPPRPWESSPPDYAAPGNWQSAIGNGESTAPRHPARGNGQSGIGNRGNGKSASPFPVPTIPDSRVPGEGRRGVGCSPGRGAGGVERLDTQCHNT